MGSLSWILGRTHIPCLAFPRQCCWGLYRACLLSMGLFSGDRKGQICSTHSSYRFTVSSRYMQVSTLSQHKAWKVLTRTTMGAGREVGLVLEVFGILPLRADDWDLPCPYI